MSWPARSTTPTSKTDPFDQTRDSSGQRVAYSVVVGDADLLDDLFARARRVDGWSSTWLMTSRAVAQCSSTVLLVRIGRFERDVHGITVVGCRRCAMLDGSRGSSAAG